MFVFIVCPISAVIAFVCYKLGYKKGHKQGETDYRRTLETAAEIYHATIKRES